MLAGKNFAFQLIKDDVGSSSSKVAALRGRLAWRFINNKDSLFHKVLASKYGNKIEFGNSNKRISSSWKIIKDGGKALNSILRWNVVNGKSINILEDKWLLDRSINKWHTYVIPQKEDNVMLDKFIHEGNWNIAELKKVFGADLMDLILQTRIKSYLIEDEQELIYQFSGKTISGLITESNQLTVSNCSFPNWLKEARANPRVETFCWRLFKDAIPTLQFLSHRR
ncbi:hypothetical protein MA16_Dca001888 [Dendrobium catenatum]|uniref:Reverse transcriptase zinc-binding domain-containing protein n=1 Tax=Dendrobium catenatum TaxID=906689 RepID=A0A2I0XDQ3_9ASPA|nr:hypothetical protein MA16_Dca001888 [Dendrobium catenatum]